MSPWTGSSGPSVSVAHRCLPVHAGHRRRDCSWPAWPPRPRTSPTTPTGPASTPRVCDRLPPGEGRPPPGRRLVGGSGQEPPGHRPDPRSHGPLAACRALRPGDLHGAGAVHRGAGRPRRRGTGRVGRPRSTTLSSWPSPGSGAVSAGSGPRPWPPSAAPWPSPSTAPEPDRHRQVPDPSASRRQPGIGRRRRTFLRIVPFAVAYVFIGCSEHER
jgi:hypothetical protein